MTSEHVDLFILVLRLFYHPPPYLSFLNTFLLYVENLHCFFIYLDSLILVGIASLCLMPPALLSYFWFLFDDAPFLIFMSYLIGY